MQVLHVCSEMFPLLKTGGLADVIGALPAAQIADGVDARVLLPAFPDIRRGVTDAQVVSRRDTFAGHITLLFGHYNGVGIYLIDAPHLYDRPGSPYHDTNLFAYTDNVLRFALLGWVGAEMASGLDPFWRPDVVHAHDWHAGLAPAYLAARGRPAKSVFTVHNLVPGGDDHMRVLTAFSDENGKVRAMCLGHTMVEEHTPHGLGNHAAIVTEDTTALPLVENIRRMLEDCHYTGFSNFDIKVGDDPTDFRVFEINLRQGRSNYYVTASGMNIARLVVEKWNDGGSDCVLNRNEVFWHHVPAQVAFTYTEDKALVEHARQLKAEGKEACSLLYKPDLAWNPVRYACVLEQLRRQFKKFKTYYPKQH